MNKAKKKFEKVSYIFTDKKDENEIIKGPLSFVAGGLTFAVFKNDGSQSNPICLESGLKKKKSKKSASKKVYSDGFGQVKVKYIVPSAQQKKPNLKSSFEETKVKADVDPSNKNA